MRAFTVDPAAGPPPGELIGAVVTEEVKAEGRKLFRKGHRLTGADLPALARVDRAFHAVRLEPGELHEDEAGRRLAVAVAGPYLEVRGPVQSRYNVVATAKGLLRVAPELVVALNRLNGVAVFTLQDRLSVLPGKIAAGVKITPVAVPEETVRAAETLAGDRPVLWVEPFQSLRVGVVTTEGLTGRVRDRFRETVERKIGWYGGEVLRFEDLPNEAAAVAGAISRLLEDGADLVLAGGGNTIDPLDPTLLALPMIGAEMVRFGAPAHPGSMFWLAYQGAVPIFNLASCSMYSKATVADLILPWIMAGERVEDDHLAALGYGGLLDRGMAFRFPPYDDEHAAEDDDE